MFAKATRQFPPVVPGQGPSSVPSIIGPEMVIKGDFKSGGELHIEGTVEGDIHVKTLTIGKDATVRGEINVEQVRVRGSVTGCIRAHEVVLTATARVIGDVHHDVLSMEAGALLEGHCRHRDGSKVDAARPAATSVATTGSNEPVRLAPVKPAEPVSAAPSVRPPLAVGSASKP
jgi:cytoskeletal protein CcmA (bactofilin family)